MPYLFQDTIPELVNLDKIINLEEPFTDIDLILVTHSHPDDFKASTCIKHLMNNPTGKLIANIDVLNFF